MSLRSLLEIVVHLESFRNIDLFFQGLYYVKVQLYNKKNDEVTIYFNIFYSFTMQILIAFLPLKFHKKNKES